MDAHRGLEPEAEERRKRKHPARAAEASPELRSDRGLRRRCAAAPGFLGLGAVAGEGVGEGEALLGWDVEGVLEDGLGMAAVGRRGGEGGWNGVNGAMSSGFGQEERAVGGEGGRGVEICVRKLSPRSIQFAVTVIGPMTTH